MRDFIPQIEPWIDDNELKHLKRVIDSTFVVESVLTKEFETLVKEHTNSKYALSMTNGTAALYCALLTLGVKDGDEVIVPNLTFIATANAVMMAGGKPIFCEVDENTLCIDVNKIENLITDKTKVIIPVHLYGNACEMVSIIKIAKKHNLKVLEDAAQGVGVLLNNQHVGTFGDIGILSYYGNKTITCGEGGIVLTNNEDYYKSCYKLKNHGRDKKGVFIHEEIGFNFSFTEMQAAIGISQMEKLERIINRKKHIHDTYVNNLTGIGDIKFQKFSENVSPVHWFTSFFTNKKKELMKFLLDNNIQTREFFYPLHIQPCYKKILNINTSFNISENLYNTGVSLPSSYILSEDELTYVISKIKKFFNNEHTISK
jgi:perosamine synthetase